MTTGQRMKHRRKSIGLSAERVAEILGVSPATIYRYENGDIEKACDMGNKAGSIAVSRMGAQSSMPTFEEIISI